MTARKASTRAASSAARRRATCEGRRKREGRNPFTGFGTSSSSCGLDQDPARHVRVKRAEIAKIPGPAEGEAEMVTGIEHLRLEAAVHGDDAVRDVVTVRPLDPRAQLHAEQGGREGEILDPDLDDR